MASPLRANLVIIALAAYTSAKIKNGWKTIA